MFRFLKNVTGRKSNGVKDKRGEEKGLGDGGDGNNELRDHADNDDEFQRHEDDECTEGGNYKVNVGSTPFARGDIRSAMDGRLLYKFMPLRGPLHILHHTLHFLLISSILWMIRV